MKQSLRPFPEGFDNNQLDKRPIAHIKFSKKSNIIADTLFQQVLDRRSNKDEFDTSQPITAPLLNQIINAGHPNSQVFGNQDGAFVENMRDLTYRAHEVESLTPHTMQESIDLMRIGKTEINANPDGIDLGGAFLEGLNAIGSLTRENMADQTSTAFAQGMDMYHGILHSAMAYLWITTPTNNRYDQINTGRSYVRLNLKATELGIGFHPISQALQEYPEMNSLYQELHKTVQAKGERVQMLVRLGYGKIQTPSPRWPVEKSVRV